MKHLPLPAWAVQTFLAMAAIYLLMIMVPWPVCPQQLEARRLDAACFARQ